MVLTIRTIIHGEEAQHHEASTARTQTATNNLCGPPVIHVRRRRGIGFWSLWGCSRPPFGWLLMDPLARG